MKKILLFGLVMVIGIFLIGCSKTTTVKTAEGTTKTVVKNSGSWCQTGSEWKSTSAGNTAKMVIKELVSSGKYKGLCHVVYDATTAGDQVNADYYFSEDGKTGYMVIDVNGQKIEQAWTG